jgi:hypothetical protein
MKKRKTHKTILILLLVLIPPYFLMFTDEGMRVSDNVMLWFFGEESVKLNLKELDHGYTREQVLDIFPDLKWQCVDEQTSFGNSLCSTPVASFNDYPAHRLTFFFGDDNVSAVKILYRQRYHDQVTGHLIEQFGQPDNVADAIKDSPDAAPVLEWDTGKGVVVQKKELAETDEPAVFWLARVR